MEHTLANTIRQTSQQNAIKFESNGLRSANGMSGSRDDSKTTSNTQLSYHSKLTWNFQNWYNIFNKQLNFVIKILLD